MSSRQPQNLSIRHSVGHFFIFEQQSGKDSIEVRYEGQTLWLTQRQMAALFGVDVRTVNGHLKNIFAEGELEADSVIRKFRTTASDDKVYNIQHYNLDAIISVGYRVNSMRATQFRQWATVILREFAIRGFALDHDRLANGGILGEDYFEHLLEQIREIRLSERRFYQKVTDIFATSADYDSRAPAAQAFFAEVQNKLHFAIHGHTAAELIRARADSAKPHMGLTSWKDAPDGKIVKTDVGVAKNYLTHEELQALGRVVGAYLDLAEDRAKRRIPTTMKQWAEQLDTFLKLSERDVLRDAGTVSAQIAHQHAEGEFAKFRVVQDRAFMSDFDKAAKAIAERAAKKDEASDE